VTGAYHNDVVMGRVTEAGRIRRNLRSHISYLRGTLGFCL